MPLPAGALEIHRGFDVAIEYGRGDRVRSTERRGDGILSEHGGQTTVWCALRLRSFVHRQHLNSSRNQNGHLESQARGPTILYPGTDKKREESIGCAKTEDQLAD